MNLERVRFLLAKAETEVAKCEAQIKERTALLAGVESAGADYAQALRDAVHQWEELQKLHLGDRDSLRRELAALQGQPLVSNVSEADIASAAKFEETIQEILRLAKDGDASGEQAPSIVGGD